MAELHDPSQPSKKQPQYNSYLKYSGLAFQLLATIAISGWLGHKLDQWLHLKYPVFMIILGFIGFSGIMYQVYRSINRE